MWIRANLQAKNPRVGPSHQGLLPRPPLKPLPTAVQVSIRVVAYGIGLFSALAAMLATHRSVGCLGLLYPPIFHSYRRIG